MFRTLTILLIFCLNLFSQVDTHINGYLQNMQTVWSAKNGGSLILSNSANNRINLTLYYNDLSFTGSIRNIFDYGEFVELVPGYNDLALEDNGYLNLTKEITSGDSYLLYSNIDRISLTYTYKNLELQIGRQRINWGINYVWTPNDIFNSASFINFDYAEKPGSDAVRAQYYFDYASSLEVVAKIDNQEKTTMAGKFQFNYWDYDFQLISGYSSSDIMFGGGWSGSISGAGFSGELTYFGDRSEANDRKNILVGSVGSNYMFENSLFLSFEFLYNSIGIVGKSKGITDIFNLDYSAKNLSPSRYSIFGQIQYPFTPLLNGSVATIVNPTDGSLFLSPTLEISLNQDVYLLGTGQFFIGENRTEWGAFGQFYYIRIKWNF